VSEPAPHRVVVVGGGFGGLFAARFLDRDDIEVTLVDRNNYHLFQPLLYQVATGILSEGEIAPALRDILRRQRNATVEMATVESFDLEARVVWARRPDSSERSYHYDSLIVAAGAGQSYFGHDEYSLFAPGMKTIDDALELRARIFGAFEMAESEEDDDVRRAWLTFVVVGGGATGVEMAGQISELAHHALRRDFRRIDPSTARIVLFDGGKEILSSFGGRLSSTAVRELGRMGVDVRCERVVVGLDRTGVDVKAPDGTTERLEARTKVWAAGVAASPLAQLLADGCDAECDRPGRIKVLPDCTLPGHPEVFAVGDMMALDDLPGVAEVAMQSGIHAANTIKRRLHGKPAAPFAYRDLGSMATISRFRAIVSFKGLRLSGFAGWLMWLVVHVTFLTGFKNRFQALLHWANTFLGGARAERTITLHQLMARIAIEEAGGDRQFTDRFRAAHGSGSVAAAPDG
jgi:NADH:ubiquinone reductase (H+-translocating)